MNLNINDLKIFLSVCKVRSITKAAELCDTSSSTVSRRIKALEQELAIKLIQKRGSAITVTPDGASFRATAKQVINKLEFSVEQLSCKRSELKGSVKLGVSHSFARHICADLIPRILEEQPEIEVDIITINPSQTYTMGEFDILVTPMEVLDKSLIARKLVTFRKYFIASNDFLRANGGAPEFPEQLENYPGIINNISRHPESNTNCSWTTEDGELGYCQTTNRIAVDSFDIAALLTKKGVGFSLLSPSGIRLLSPSDCTVLFDGKIFKEQSIYIAYRDREYITERVRYVISELFSFIDEHPEFLKLSGDEITAYIS